MNYQMPAEGILKHNDWGDSKVYRVTCECGCADCEHNVWVEAEDTGVTVTIYTTTKTNFWNKTRWYHIWTLLTKGYIDTESTVCLKSQGALNYAETLKSAIDDVTEFRNARQTKQENAIITKMANEQDCV
jgi:uncharacterized protein YqkB